MGTTVVIHVVGHMVGIIGGIIEGIVERVDIIIKGVGIIIKGVDVIKRVATFPKRLRHFCFFGVWKVADSTPRIQRWGFLSEGRSTDRVLEAEEKRGRTYLAALLANFRANQPVEDPTVLSSKT